MAVWFARTHNTDTSDMQEVGLELDMQVGLHGVPTKVWDIQSLVHAAFPGLDEVVSGFGNPELTQFSQQTHTIGLCCFGLI